jgi:hypothetical protein
MGALFHTPGPILHYVRFRGAAAFLYLGTAEVSPVDDGDPAYLPVMNDRKSRTKPMQKIYDGTSAAVTTLINHLDLAVWRRVRDAQSHSAAPADYGIDGKLELGALTMGVGDFQIAFINSFYGTSQASADLPQGRLYYSAVVGNYQETPGGTRAWGAAVRFDCDSFLAPYGDANAGDFPLYTEVLTGLTFPAPTG